jgi:hypothetical protein
MVRNIATLLLAPALALAAAIPEDKPEYSHGQCTLNFKHVQMCPPTDKPDGDTYLGFFGTNFVMTDGGQKTVPIDYEAHINGQDLGFKRITPYNNIDLADTGNPKGSLANFNTGMGWLTITIPRGNPWTLQFDGFGDQHWNSSFDDGGKASSHTSGAQAWCTDGGGWQGWLGPAPDKQDDIATGLVRGIEAQVCKEAPTACEKAPDGDVCKHGPNPQLRVSPHLPILVLVFKDCLADCWTLVSRFVLCIQMLRLRLRVGLIRPIRAS